MEPPAGLSREDGDAVACHALDLVAEAGEKCPDGARLVFVGSVSVWRTPDGVTHVVTLQTHLGG